MNDPRINQQPNTVDEAALHGGAGRADAPLETVAEVGSVTSTRVPCPGRLSIAIRPPCRSTIAWQIASPNPLPDAFTRVEGTR